MWVLKFITPLENFKSLYPKSRMYADLPIKIFVVAVFVHVPNILIPKLNSVFSLVCSKPKGI